MKLGLQISSFTWPGGDERLGPTLADIARTADEAGFDSIWVMDHFIQIGSVGKPEEPMLEGMTALGFMAAHTRRARLGLMVGGIHYRQAGLWLKAATTTFCRCGWVSVLPPTDGPGWRTFTTDPGVVTIRIGR